MERTATDVAVAYVIVIGMDRSTSSPEQNRMGTGGFIDMFCDRAWSIERAGLPMDLLLPELKPKGDALSFWLFLFLLKEGATEAQTIATLPEDMLLHCPHGQHPYFPTPVGLMRPRILVRAAVDDSLSLRRRDSRCNMYRHGSTCAKGVGGKCGVRGEEF